MPARAAGDVGALRRAYQAGVTLGGGGGLASIPVFDARSLQRRRRLSLPVVPFRRPRADEEAERPRRQPSDVARRRPCRAVVGRARTVGHGGEGRSRRAPPLTRRSCATNRRTRSTAAGWRRPHRRRRRFVAEPQTFGSQPNSECNKSYPSYSFVRQVAGGPLDGNVLKCQLKPIDPKDYGVGARRGRSPAPAPDLPGRRVRLVEARREPGAGAALGLVRSSPGEPPVERHELATGTTHAGSTPARSGHSRGQRSRRHAAYHEVARSTKKARSSIRSTSATTLCAPSRALRQKSCDDCMTVAVGDAPARRLRSPGSRAAPAAPVAQRVACLCTVVFVVHAG